MEYAIGIDLGGTSIKYALVDKAGNSFFVKGPFGKMGVLYRIS